MADVSKVGLGLPPFIFEVDKLKIKELVHAIGETTPFSWTKKRPVQKDTLTPRAPLPLLP